ncbi:MAG: VWA domain-containing protein, partial [Muribaculaceae bacterium]|nr:VWA domain-containing protein [Muribaculaceae bacterium]
MFSFANPQYLYLLILLPCVVGLYLLARRARRKRLERMGKRSIIEGLMPETSNSKPVVRLTLQLLLLALVIIILARPQAGVRKTTVTSTGIEAFIALDLSNSMRASSTSNIDDISRLQRSKQVLEKLIDKLNGNKVGLIVFAGRAYMQMPLTTDCMLAKMYLASLDTDLIPTQGTAIGEAIDMAAKSFSDNPKVQKSIIIITDGENFEDDAVAAATQAGKN